MSHTRVDVFARIVNVGHPFVEYDRRHELHQSPRAAGRDRIGSTLWARLTAGKTRRA